MNAYITGVSDSIFDPPFLTNGDEDQPLILLELGSGTGIVSARCAERLSRTECTIITTDLPEVCSLLERNLSRYITPLRASAPHILVRPLAWGNSEHALAILRELTDASNETSTSHPGPRTLTHIICSDLVSTSSAASTIPCGLTADMFFLQVYFPELLAPLLRSLLHLSSPPFVSEGAPELWPKVIISYKVRSLSKETPFWSAFGLWFSFEPVLVRKTRRTQADDKDVDSEEEDAWSRFGSDGEDNLFIFVGRRRPESLAWDIPPSDTDLLAGVGARGDNSSKSDDTFDTLLLMALPVG